MLAKITLYDGTIYKIADKTTDTQDGLYLGRIKDELSLVSAMQEAGNAPATINLTIINHDDFIPHSKDLWAADVLLTNDNGVSWRGKINFCNFDADGNLYVTASEKTAPELELQLPDEVRQVYTVDEDFHQSSVTMTIPLVIGGTHEKPILVPTILIDKTQGIYLICVGEIREVVNVYSGSEKLPQWEYNSWRGTAEQPYHKGFAYVTIGYNKRFNADGSYAEINVEVVGLKLGDFTEEECRNGALFLYYFLTTAATGINGWGCGIDQSEIDTASFQSAITLCNQLGYKLDGIMWLRQSAQSWIDQICQAIHGKYSINANGKRSLFIDYAGNASKKTFTASNMQVERYGKNSYTSVVYNKGILSYDYNPITGLFMQSAQYENAESIAQIGEQKFVGESYLLKDPTTALAVLEYTCKRSQTAAEAIEFKTDDINTVLRAGDVITINRPDLSINNALYQIQNISITDYEASISAVKFDTSVFIVSGTPSSVNWGSEKAITPALTPAQATNLLLSTGFDINPDGTGTPYISGTFTVPEGGWLAAAVQYGIGTNPSNWTEMALITEGRFKLSPVNVDTVYSIRVRMITATGHSSFITGVITATGDTTPPLAPTIAVNATDKTVTVKCGLDNPPYDMGGFQIYRKKSTEADSAYTLIAMVAANRGYASYSDYVSEYITYNYKAKSYDRSGNLSTNFSNVASVTVTGIQANDVAATALAMPTGSILRLSAKNCTTESIAQTVDAAGNPVYGVKDVSGNGNHLRAYGGLAVVKDEVFGECFSFDGSNDYIYSNESRILNQFNNLKGLTISARIKADAVNGIMNILEAFITGSTTSFKFAISSGKIVLGGRRASNNSYESTLGNEAIEAGKIYTLTGVFDYENAKVRMYINAELDKETNFQSVGVFTAVPTTLFIGKYNSSLYLFDGIISDFRIYPRALSASEIKTIYMFPDDVTFGQMTADLIGANVIKASNLVYTENIITQTAQIKDAIITNAKIADLNASKINAGTLDAARIAANAITAEKLSVTAANEFIAPRICALAPVSGTDGTAYSTGDLIPDISGNGNGGTVKGTITPIKLDNRYGYGFNNNDPSGSIKLATNLKTTTSRGWTLHFKMTVGTQVNSNPYIFDFGVATTTRWGVFINNDSKLAVTADGSDRSGTKTVSANTSYDVLFRMSANKTWALYIDGVAVDNGTASTKQTKLTSSLIIFGRYQQNDNRSFIGTIWNFEIYDDGINPNAEQWAKLLNGWQSEAGTITADRIAAGCVETRHLTADAIVGKTFQTASNTGTSNAAGVRFNSSGIQGFNGSAKKFDLNTNGKLTCSDVDLTGKITASSGKIGLWSISDNILKGIFSEAQQSINILYDPLIYTKYTTNSGRIFEHKICPARIRLDDNNIGGNPMYAIIEAAVSEFHGPNTSTNVLIIQGKVTVNGSVVHGSDENIKSEIKDVSVLEKLKKIQVKSWKYDEAKIARKEYENELNKFRNGLIDKEPVLKTIETKRASNNPTHIGAMAKEFNETFGTSNNSEDYISYTDEIGVCMRAIQELAEISDAQKIEIDSQKAEIAELKAKLKIQQDEKSDVEQEASYTEKSDNSKDTDNLDFPDVGKNGENQQEEQKTDEK